MTQSWIMLGLKTVPTIKAFDTSYQIDFRKVVPVVHTLQEVLKVSVP